MAALAKGHWILDLAHSEIGLTIRHAGISKVRAQFSDAAAKLEVKENGTAALEATIKTESFVSKNEDRDAHVRGEDFLNVEKYPEAVFSAKQFNVTAEEFELTGDLTICGHTQQVSFDVEFGGQAVDPFGATRAGFSGSTAISRKEFGLTWNAALDAGGVLVGDKVSIDLEVAFVLEA